MARVIDPRWMVAASAAVLLVAGGGIARRRSRRATDSPPVGAGRRGRTPARWAARRPSGAGGLLFLDASATREFLQANQNLPSGRELGAVVRVVDEGHSWFALFTFSEEGYVDDSDKDAIDADALLASMKKGNEEGNAERQKRGWAPLTSKAGRRSRSTIPHSQPDVGHAGSSPGETPPSIIRCASSAAVA